MLEIVEVETVDAVPDGTELADALAHSKSGGAASSHAEASDADLIAYTQALSDETCEDCEDRK